jgi:hypothetical protein
MTSRLYIRRVTITRPPAQPGVGFQPGYAASVQADETPVIANLPASIQLVREGGSNPVGLPADSAQPLWNILMPKGAVAEGQVKEGDIATDDLANRFQIIAAYVNRLGANFRAQSLKP